MSTLTPYKEFTLTAAEQLSGLQVVDDPWFDRCALIKQNQTLSLGRASDIGINSAAFTTSVWLKLNDLNTSMTFAANKGWQILAGGKLALAGAQGVDGLTEGQWHYITWINDSHSNALYLDGNLIQTQAIAADAGLWLDANQNLEYQISIGEVRLSHQHFYAHALTLPDVMLDRASRLPAAARSFTEYYPLDFKITNLEEGPWKLYPDNNLFIVDSDADNQIEQQLIISNQSSKSIQFKPFAVGQGIDTHHHFRIRIRNGVFAQPADNPQIAALNDAAHWEIERAEDVDTQDGCWSFYIRSLKDLTLSSKQTQSFTFNYRSADGVLGARSSIMLMTYQGQWLEEGGDLQGERSKRLDILNLSSNNTYITKLNDSISEADKKVDNLQDEMAQSINELKQDISKQANQADINSQLLQQIEDLKTMIKTSDQEHEGRSKVLEEQIKSANYPLRAYHDAPTGTVCNDSGTLNLFLYNHSDTDAQLTTKSKVLISLPYGDKTSDMADTHKENGNGPTATLDGNNLDKFAKGNNASAVSSVYTFKPKADTVLKPGKFIQFGINNVKPNKSTGVCFVDVDVNGLSGYNNTTLNVAIKKITRDLGQLAGADNVGIGTDSANPSHRLTVEGQGLFNGNLSTTGIVSDKFGEVVPVGTIVMWSGKKSTVPKGWAICDGNNNTPNLSDRFVLASPNDANLNKAGGNHSYSLTQKQLPKHTHGVTDKGHAHGVSDPGHRHSMSVTLDKSSTDKNDDSLPIYARRKSTSYTTTVKTGIKIQSHNTGISLVNTGSSAAVDNRPKYYTLYYIIKVAK